MPGRGLQTASNYTHSCGPGGRYSAPGGPSSASSAALYDKSRGRHSNLCTLPYPFCPRSSETERPVLFKTLHDLFCLAGIQIRPAMGRRVFRTPALTPVLSSAGLGAVSQLGSIVPLGQAQGPLPSAKRRRLVGQEEQYEQEKPPRTPAPSKASACSADLTVPGCSTAEVPSSETWEKAGSPPGRGQQSTVAPAAAVPVITPSRQLCQAAAHASPSSTSHQQPAWLGPDAQGTASGTELRPVPLPLDVPGWEHLFNGKHFCKAVHELGAKQTMFSSAVAAALTRP